MRIESPPHGRMVFLSWVNESVFYHIYPLGFCGAPQQNEGGEPVPRIEKLLGWIPHLREMQVNALYLGPVFESSEHGYDTSDYYTFDRRLGANEDLAQVCRAFPQVGFEAYHQDEVFTFRANEVTRHHLTRCHLTGVPRAIEAMPVPWIKVILQHPDPGMLQQVQTYVRTQWPEDYDVTFSNPYLLEVTAKGANKGLSVLWVANHLQVKRQDIYCVGNGLNDIPMLQVSALSFAPANSYPAVRAAADVVLPSCDESCVAEMIRQLEARYPATP